MPIFAALGLISDLGDRYWVLPEQQVGGHRVGGFASRDEKDVIRDIPFANVHALALSLDGSTLAVAATPFKDGEANRGVDLFDVAKRQKLGSLTGLRQPVTALAFSRDGRRFAAGDHLGAIRVWERKLASRER